MEALDAHACRRVADAMGGKVPILTSRDYDMYQLVSILRACHLMVSSRYHGIVTSMPGGVASAGVTMDERIRNLMHERGHQHLLLEVDEAQLEEKLYEIMLRLEKEREAIADDIGRTVVRNLQSMAQMGVYFEEHVKKRYPDFPVRTGTWSWDQYLPPLGANLQQLLAAQT